MKKIVSLLLVFAMLFSMMVLASCGESTNTPKSTTTTETPKPTDPIEIMRDTFSEGAIYRTISEVKKPIDDAKNGFQLQSSRKQNASVAINKLDVSGTPFLPSPLVLSGELAMNKKAAELKGKISFLGDEINGTFYATTKSGKEFSESTLSDGDYSVFADFGTLYQGYLGLDYVADTIISSVKDSMSGDDGGAAAEIFSKLQGAADKYFSDEQTKKIAADISSAVNKALDIIPENTSVKSTADLVYKDIYTAKDAKKTVITISEKTVAEMIVAFLTELNTNSKSALFADVKKAAELDKAIENANNDLDSVSDESAVITVISNDEAALVQVGTKDGDKETKAVEVFAKDDSGYAEIFDTDSGKTVVSSKFIYDGSKAECAVELDTGRETVGKIVLSAKCEKTAEGSGTFEAALSAGSGENEVSFKANGDITTTGDRENGGISGSVTLSIGAKGQVYSIPVTFKNERKDNKISTELTLSVSIPDLVSTEIVYKSESELVDGDIEIAVPDASSATQITEDNAQDTLSTLMMGLYQSCPNIILYIANLSQGGDDTDWD